MCCSANVQNFNALPLGVEPNFWICNGGQAPLNPRAVLHALVKRMGRACAAAVALQGNSARGQPRWRRRWVTPAPSAQWPKPSRQAVRVCLSCHSPLPAAHAFPSQAPALSTVSDATLVSAVAAGDSCCSRKAATAASGRC